MKIAVYVEGHTELIFVRELLLKWYDYDATKVGFRCYNLRDSAIPTYTTDYPFGDINSTYFYEIVNVGNDASVLSASIKNARRYQNLHYDRIVALRDMFSDTYHCESYRLCGERKIHPSLNERFKDGAMKSIKQRQLSDFISINFAIMEIECWLLGMGWYLEKEDKLLNQTYLCDNLGLNLDEDQETTVYHPAEMLSNIYQNIGKRYCKHEGDVNSIMSKLERNDFEMLLQLPKCNSFNTFMAQLLPTPCQ